MNSGLCAAAALSLSIAALHTFVGSRTDVRPLLESNLAEPAKSTLYLCWHLVTIVLFAVAALFAWSAADSRTLLPGVIATTLCGCFALWGSIAALIRRRSMLRELPQGWLFILPTIAGLFGLR